MLHSLAEDEGGDEVGHEAGDGDGAVDDALQPEGEEHRRLVRRLGVLRAVQLLHYPEEEEESVLL